MPLKVDQVARLAVIGCMEEVIEPHLEQRGEGGVGGNVAADAGIVLVLPDHHGHGVPADQALDAALHGAIARVCQFVFGTNGIDVGRVQMNGQVGTLSPRALGKLFQQVCGAVRPGLVDHLLQRFQPLSGLLWI